MKSEEILKKEKKVIDMTANQLIDKRFIDQNLENISGLSDEVFYGIFQKMTEINRKYVYDNRASSGPRLIKDF